MANHDIPPAADRGGAGDRIAARGLLGALQHNDSHPRWDRKGGGVGDSGCGLLGDTAGGCAAPRGDGVRAHGRGRGARDRPRHRHGCRDALHNKGPQDREAVCRHLDHEGDSRLLGPCLRIDAGPAGGVQPRDPAPRHLRQRGGGGQLLQRLQAGQPVRHNNQLHDLRPPAGLLCRGFEGEAGEADGSPLQQDDLLLGAVARAVGRLRGGPLQAHNIPVLLEGLHPGWPLPGGDELRDSAGDDLELRQLSCSSG